LLNIGAAVYFNMRKIERIVYIKVTGNNFHDFSNTAIYAIISAKKRNTFFLSYLLETGRLEW
jgi:hypothetical protein